MVGYRWKGKKPSHQVIWKQECDRATYLTRGSGRGGLFDLVFATKQQKKKHPPSKSKSKGDSEESGSSCIKKLQSAKKISMGNFRCASRLLVEKCEIPNNDEELKIDGESGMLAKIIKCSNVLLLQVACMYTLHTVTLSHSLGPGIPSSGEITRRDF